MATISEARALPFFTDLQGLPLESGSIYIGQPGLDPIAYPATVTSDAAGNVVLEQPIRTVHGRATSGGALVHMFCPIPYSITVLDAAGRAVYVSTNETDPAFAALTSSTVQSASSLSDLRSRSGSLTNQIWVNGYGMYVYDPTDDTSPEALPYLVVGNDGSRYKSSAQYGIGPYFKAQSAANPATAGGYFSYNDGADRATYLTTNQGNGAGGHVFRTVNGDNSGEVGRVSITGTGSIVATSDIHANGNLLAAGGAVFVKSDGTRALIWDATNSQYTLQGAPLAINGSTAITLATLSAAMLANQLAQGVGAVAVGNNIAPNPPLPGTWVSAGTASNSVYLWVRSV